MGGGGDSWGSCNDGDGSRCSNSTCGDGIRGIACGAARPGP